MASSTNKSNLELLEGLRSAQTPQEFEKRLQGMYEFSLRVDDTNVYVTRCEYYNGKLDIDWFTFKHLDKKEMDELGQHIEIAICKYIKEHQCSSKKQSSRIWSTIKNIFARFGLI